MLVQRKPLGTIHCTMKMLKYTEFLMVGLGYMILDDIAYVQCYIQLISNSSHNHTDPCKNTTKELLVSSKTRRENAYITHL